MQTPFILVALICLSLQIALPLATSYDNGLHRDRKFADSENLVQRHHVRHRPSHLRSSDNIRNQQYTEMDKSESSTSWHANNFTDITNFEHSHHQHDNKVQPESNHLRALDRSNYQKESDDDHDNFIHHPPTHAHLHYRNVPKSRIIAIAATTIDTESSTSTIGLVKPTSHPTTNAAHTITLDEVNKSTPNYSHQTMMRQHHKQHRHQLQQHNHKMQLKLDMSETKHTVAPANGLQHNLSAVSQNHKQLLREALRLSGSLQSDNHTSESINNNITASELQQSTLVGGSTENILVTTSEANIAEAQLATDERTEYVDEEVDYYDYSIDNDESNVESRDYQHALASIDVGYYYDSGIDDDEAEWHAHTPKNSKNEYHEHTHHSQERAQPHRRQQSHRQKQNNLEAQSYRNEHSRVARDHHRTQSQHFGHNNFVYDSRSEYEYPDDEPYKDSSEQFANRPGELTLEKYRELGTMQAVQQSRDLYMQRHKSPSDLATEHINRMKVAARCSRPLPRVFHVSNDTSKTYVPSCTILHRCGEDTGCCRSMGQVCTVKTYEDVPLHFIVIQVNSSNSRRQTEIEILRLRNDTECHCINRTDLTSAPEFNTRDKRSGLAVRRPIQSQFHELDSQIQLTNRSASDENKESYPNIFCRCPKHFDVFQGDIRWQFAQPQHELHSSSAQAFNCRCDCADTTSPCQRFKNGEEGFAMDDRRCIGDKICSVPNCSFGIFNEQMGRCPRPFRKHKRHNNGFG